MPDRSVKITVGANVSPLKAAMADGARSVEGLGGTVTTLGQKLKSGLGFVGVTGGIVSLGAAIKSTFSLGLDFTTQLNTLQAVSGATAQQMAQVSTTAKQLGNDISIPATSASDAAQAMTELAKGGLSVDQAMQAAKGTLQLAAAASVSGAQAAEIQANALNTFGLSADQAGHVADVLANTANAASGEITDFAQGMQQAGGVANLFGVSLDDTATVLGIFAKAGVIGSDAGTSLKTALTQLATPTANAQKAMDALGLTVYDGNGKFVGMRSLTDQLSQAQARMTQQAFQSAAGILFGNDAIRAAAFLAKSGVSGYDDMRAAIERTGGAAELAAAKMKGLPGALQNLRNELENVALEVYQRVAPAMESLVNWFADAIPAAVGVIGPIFSTLFTVIGKLADAFNALPGPVQAFGVAMVGLAIAQKIGLISSLSSAFDTVRLRAMYAGDAIRAMSFSSIVSGARAAGGAMLSAFGGPVGIAIAAAVAGVALLAQHWDDAKPKVRDFTALVDENTGALSTNARQAAVAAAKDDILQWAKRGGDVTVYTDALLGNSDAIASVQASLSAMAAVAFQSSAYWKVNAATFQAYGFTAKQVSDAVIQNAAGNSAALESMFAAMGQNAMTGTAALNAALGGLVPIAAQFAANQAAVNQSLKDGATLAAAAADGANKTSGAVTTLSGAMQQTGAVTKDTGEKALTAAQRVQALGSSMQAAGSGASAYRQSVVSLAGAQADVAQAMFDAEQAAKKSGHAVFDAAGDFDLSQQATRDAVSQMYSYRDSAFAAASAAAAQAAANGDVAGATAAAQSSLNGASASFVDMAMSILHVTRPQAQAIAAELGFLQRIQIDPKTFTVTMIMRQLTLQEQIDDPRLARGPASLVTPPRVSAPKITMPSISSAIGGVSLPRSSGGGGGSSKAKQAADDAAKAARDRQDALAKSVTTAIERVGQAGQKSVIDLGSVSMVGIVTQISSAERSLAGAVKNGLNPAQAKPLQDQLLGLAKQAGAQFKALQKQINTTDFATLRKSLSGTVSDARDAVGKLITDLRSAGASSSVIIAISAKEDQLTAAMSRRESVVKKLSEAQDALNNLLGQYDQRVQSVTGSMQSYVSIVSQPAEGQAVTAESLIADMQKRATTAQSFADNLAKLKAAGLGTTSLNQLIDAGPAQAAAQAAALASATSTQIQQINQLADSALRSGTGLGQLSADSMYSRGIDAARALANGLASQRDVLTRQVNSLGASIQILAQNDMKLQGQRAMDGLIDGLQSKDPALNKAMRTLGGTMLKTFKAALGIHSPSKVMAEQVGKPTVDGVIVGMQSRMDALGIAGSGIASVLGRIGASSTAGDGGPGGGAMLAELRALRAETAALRSDVRASSAQNAATVVGGLQDQARHERRTGRAGGI